MTDTANKGGDQTGQAWGAGDATAKDTNASTTSATDTWNGDAWTGSWTGDWWAGDGDWWWKGADTKSVPEDRFKQVYARAKTAEEELAVYKQKEKDQKQKDMEAKGQYEDVLKQKNDEISSLTAERDTFKTQAEEYWTVVQKHSKSVVDSIVEWRTDEEKASIDSIIGWMSPMEILQKQDDLKKTFGQRATNTDKWKLWWKTSQTQTVADDELFNKGNKDARTNKFMDELNSSASAIWVKA